MLARYVVRRLLQLIPVLVLVSLAVFLLVRAIPGDPVLVMLGIDPDARARISEEQYRVLQHQFGLDRPIYLQYLNWADKIICRAHHRHPRWRNRRDQAEHPPGLRRDGICSLGCSDAQLLARAHVDRSFQFETRMASRNRLREPL